jgi:hypothetical protein
MLYTCTLLLLVVCVLSLEAVKPNNYGHFEDYLINLDQQMQDRFINITKNDTEDERRRLEDWGNNLSDEQRENQTCCMLGELAGDKGFHCYVDFYAARIVLRNRNRAHNRKTGFYGRFRVLGRRYGKRLMSTFEQCVAGQAIVFHRCCRIAALQGNINENLNNSPAFDLEIRRDRKQLQLFRQQARDNNMASSTETNTT